MALLCWGSYLVKKMREYISLSLVMIDVDGFIIQAPRVLVHPYVSCLILLINTAMYYGVWGIQCWLFKGQKLIAAKGKEQKVFSFLSLSPTELRFCHIKAMSVSKQRENLHFFTKKFLKSNLVWRNKPMLLWYGLGHTEFCLWMDTCNQHEAGHNTAYRLPWGCTCLTWAGSLQRPSLSLDTNPELHVATAGFRELLHRGASASAMFSVEKN